MKFTDGTRTVDIKMVGINGIDWTADFYNAVQWEGEEEPYHVDHVQDIIDAAVEYCNHDGDYSDITDTETEVYVDGELIAKCEEETRIPRLYILKETLDPSGMVIQKDEEDYGFQMPDAIDKAEAMWKQLSESDKKKHRISVILCRQSKEGDYADLSDGYEIVARWT